MKTEPITLFYLLLLSLFSGFSMGLLRDLLLFLGQLFGKLFLKSTSKKKTFHTILQALQDLVFCLLIFFTLIVILFYYSEGKIRFFSVMALFLGFLLYRISIGQLFVRFSTQISEKVANAISWLAIRFTSPILRLGVWIFRCVTKPIRAYGHRIRERRLQKYSSTRMQELRKISKKGFVNIEWKTYGM